MKKHYTTSILLLVFCCYILVKNMVVNYILTRQVSDKASEQELKLLEILTKSDQLRRSKESADAVPIITTYKLSINQVSSSLHQKADVSFTFYFLWFCYSCYSELWIITAISKNLWNFLIISLQNVWHFWIFVMLISCYLSYSIFYLYNSFNTK